MKISVCIPLYNGEHCIESALASLEAQTRQPDEVIIRDDCSNDSGRNIINKFSNLCIDFYTNNKNLGTVSNWNKCLEDATGDIVTFLHQDDGFEPEFLSNVEKDFLNNFDKIGLWYCNSYIKDTPIIPSNRDSGILQRQASINNFYTWDEAPAPTGVSFKNLALQDIGIYDPIYKIVCEPDLYLRLVLGGYSVFKSEEFLVWRTFPATRATNTVGGTELYYNEWLMFLEEHSANGELVNKEMIIRALSNFYDHSSSSIVSNVIKLRFREAIGTIKTIFTRARNFEVAHGVDEMGLTKFIFLVFKNMLRNLYFFLRSRLALIYRRIK